MRLDDASGVEGTWIDAAAPLPQGTAALLKHAGETYLPFLAANARALREGAETFEVELLGQPFAQAPFRYQGKCFDALRKRLAALPASVRQRLDRLENAGYVEKRKNSAGRGRPTFSYFLTDLGWRQVGVTYTDLAVALWGEILLLEEGQTRSKLIDRVSKRMGRSFKDLLPEGSLEERMKSLAGLMAARRIPASFVSIEGLPILSVHACPYPDLTGRDSDRSLCDLEQQVLSEAIGQPLELSCCRLDGHGTCQFKPIQKQTIQTSNP